MGAAHGVGAPPQLRYFELGNVTRHEKSGVIHGLLREINDPAVPFIPAEDSAQCAECPYAVTCDRLG